MEILTAVIPTILEYTIMPVVRHVSYPFNWKSNVGDLEEKVQSLQNEKQRLEDKRESERRNGKEIYSNVDGWLNEADEILEKKSEELLHQAKGNTRCVFGVFPDLMKRYQLSRKAEKKSGDVAKLLERRFTTISRAAPLQGMEASSVRDYEVFESRASVLQEVKNALTADDVCRVGLYGIGGMGKTTLAKEVARQAKDEKLFDEVVFVNLNREVKVEIIQYQIADQLGLKFDEQSVQGRACRLHGRLKQEKKLLLILDDLGETLDMGAVGIPSSNQHPGCKLLFTSRDLQVLSDEMDCQKNFEVGALLENEAWDLFKKMAGCSFENDDRHSIAVDVAKACDGLPSAIVTKARSLRNKNSLPEWRKALRDLEKPRPTKTTLKKIMTFKRKNSGIKRNNSSLY